MSTFDWDLCISNPQVDALQVKNLIWGKFGEDLGSVRTEVYKHDQRISYGFVPVSAPCTLDVWDGLRVKQVSYAVSACLGFDPNLSVYGSLTEDLTGPNFTYATREESEAAGLLFLVKAMDHVLSNVEGDAVIRADEYFILLRRNGKVVLDPRRGRWSPELLGVLSFKYESGEIPSSAP